MIAPTPRRNVFSRLTDGLLIIATIVCLFAVVITSMATVTAKEPPGSRKILGVTEQDWLPSADARLVGDYYLSYDGRARTARYVVEFLRPTDISVVDRASGFRADPDAPPEARASNADYAGTPYDKGHFAPADAHKASAELQRETFRLSNVAPQWGPFNRKHWRLLEASVRTLADSTECVVITSPLYLPDDDEPGHPVRIETLGANHVWIPTHYGKAVLYRSPDGDMTLLCWIMPNNDLGDTSPDAYRVSGDVFESAIGFDLFAALPDPIETPLEKQ